MCGIFGIVGKRDAINSCIKGLKRLEYRGYDSAGIAGLEKGELHVIKEKGKICALEDLLLDNPFQLETAIAHTRWATHGEPNQKNAHPHFDQQRTVAVVHNGIIENHQPVKDELIEAGITFHSDTDTEVIAQLIAHLYDGDFKKTVLKALGRLKGAFALAIVHKNHPDQIIAAARESPLAIARDGEGTLLSSDPNVFVGDNLSITYLHNNEMALLTEKGVTLFSESGEEISKEAHTLTLEQDVISKNGFDHFMLKEIHEQPFSVQRALNQELSAKLDYEQILILGCGTSYHAGLIGASLLQEIARIPTSAEIASEFRYTNPIISDNTLVIAISQSGETADTLAAVRDVKVRGAKVLGICNVPHSSLTRIADTTLFLDAGPEISVCSTKAFTSQLTVLSHLASQKNEELPRIVTETLSQSKTIEALAKKYSQYEKFFFIGRRYMYPTCLEAALKLKEISYLNACAYPGGEMKHGPIALLDKNLPVIALLGNEQTFEKMMSNLMEAKARGAPVFAVAPEGRDEILKVADDVLFLPKVSDLLAPIPYSVAMQLFAYYVAKALGTEIDQPRNLAKSVTVE